MQNPDASSLNRPHTKKSYRILSLALSLFALVVTVGSFTLASAQSAGQDTPIFVGDIQTPKTNEVEALPEAAPVYTDLWAVQVTSPDALNTLTRNTGFENLGQIGTLEGYYLLRATGSTARSENLTATLRAQPGILWAEQQILRQQYPRVPSDPLYPTQWHLNNTGQSGGTAGADANVVAAWNAGFTGTGVQIAIVDDGLEIAHPDIAPNYFAGGSFDFNSNEANPTGDSGDPHGTSAGGVAAASDDGTECGVGAAYNAQLAGVRLISGPVTDATEAQALTYANQQNDIYNNSWGPSDNGQVLGKPGPLLTTALEQGVTTGRGGLGSIFVWAAGNGFTSGDHANADGYANSRFVIAVGASTNQGVQSYYSEIGANVMVNAPSNGGTAGIVTTDLLGSSGYNAGAGSQPADTDCNNSFGGTSSAAPLVAGITGLILEANPNLTWRDVQHILIDSAEKNDPSGTGVKTWATNAAGYDINYAYGFGRVDAGAAVALADTWTNVPAQTTPFNSGVLTANVAIPDGTGNPGQGAVISRTVNVPQNFIVEHVEVVLDIDHTKRGEVIAAITSPSGTSSTLLFPRVNDTGDNYDNWKTSSLRTWGESSQGTWTLSVADYYAGTTGTLASWQLIIYGYPAGGVTPTNTPGGPTSTPTSTPTVTPTELPGGAVELVQNGGFEEVDGAGEPVLAPWEVKNSTGDKIKCNKEDKVFANSGTCAFRFKGGPDEASAIQQNLDLTDIVPQAGDTVDFSWAMNVPAGSVGKSKIVIKYSDGTEPIKASADWEETVGYENWGTTASVVLDSGNIDKIKFSASNKSVSGKVYFDDISVIYTPAEETLLGLPGFSTSATGKNAVSIGPR